MASTRRQLLYIPLTEHDEHIHRDLRYRAGRILRREGIGLALAFVICFPIAVLLDWRDGSGGTSQAQSALLLLMWLLSLLGVYAWLFFARQDWGEQRRAYRIDASKALDDPDVSNARQVLESGTSARSEREAALHVLLTRGACSPNTVSLYRELRSAALALVIVGLLFFVLARLA